MKHGPNPVQRDPDPRSLTLADFCTALCEQRLDISPRDAGPRGFGENRGDRRAMLAAQVHIVSRIDIASAELNRRRGCLPQLHHLPVADRHAAVHAGGEVQVVGGDQGGEAGRLDQRGEGPEHVVGGLGVEIAGRLVGEQDARAVGDRAGDGDALLLAARELRRAMGLARGEAEIAEQLARAIAPPRRATGPRSSAAGRGSPAPRIPAAGDGTGRRSRSGCA